MNKIELLTTILDSIDQLANLEHEHSDRVAKLQDIRRSVWELQRVPSPSSEGGAP